MDADMSAKPPVAPTAAGQDEVLVLAMADSALQEGLRFEAEYDPFASEQTWPTNEEIAEAEAEAKKQRQVETAANKVDAPVDRPARVRSARYRGMKSLRTSAWDLKQSLPLDYARLFQVEDFAMVQRLALARGKDAERAMKGQLRRKSQDPANSFSEALLNEFGEMGYVPSGVYVTLHLKAVPVAKLQARIQAGLLSLAHC
ncbi:hypothetical protein PI125_g11540 [Phytophthora idaei]|nr:hypothetical protein PI125_g11540 [Phytophthora idaei]KAG3157814.1 hypothetical protein PI126_g8139 [Phytophthora idaei]